MKVEKKDIQEQLRSAGAQVLDGAKKLAQMGSVRRLRVRDPNGKVLVQLPFSATVLGAVIAPVWAAAALLGAVATGHTVDVERTDVEEEDAPGVGQARPPAEHEARAPH